MPKQLNQQQALRYSRQILLPSFDMEGQESLLNAKVLQIGAGGLGCACAQFLVSSGIGEITIVDDDIVELTNLQRQVLHGESDLGISKVQSAYNSLQKLNSECKINIIEQRLDDNALQLLAETHDIIVDCSDNLATRNQLNNLSISNLKPLVSGAAIRLEGQISTFIPGPNNPCYQCLSKLFGEQNLSCVESGVLAPVVGIIGSMQALETIKTLSGLGENSQGKLLMLDAASSQWRTFTITKDPQCSACN